MVELITKLVVPALLLAGLIWMSRRGVGTLSPALGTAQVKVLSRTGLTRQASTAVVTIADKVYLLGVSDQGGVTVLDDLTGRVDPGAVEAARAEAVANLRRTLKVAR